ncbi:hypothetical protein CEB3_c18630 [Peptococcaceae bacterium CEB3]|nr:hypothetical protein CEB3_c18630 [Peptococcaceae bacterium CEB3]
MELSDYITWIFGIIVAVLLGVVIYKFLPSSFQTWFSGFFSSITSGLTGWGTNAVNGNTN